MKSWVTDEYDLEPSLFAVSDPPMWALVCHCSALGRWETCIVKKRNEERQNEHVTSRCSAIHSMSSAIRPLHIDSATIYSSFHPCGRDIFSACAVDDTDILTAFRGESHSGSSSSSSSSSSAPSDVLAVSSR